MLWRLRTYTWAMLIMLFVWPGWAQNLSSNELPQHRKWGTEMYLSQLNTVAICGSPTCECGSLNRVSQEDGPCTASSATGSCQVGSGQCCVCAITETGPSETTAVCSDLLCNCGDNPIVTKVGAPCSVTATQGQCQTGDGECCLCVAK